MVVWSESLMIGFEVVDNEHKEILEGFDRLYALMRAGEGHDYYRLLLDFLMDYVSNHLKHEELLMEQINYDKIDTHKMLHKEFKEKIVALETNHRLGKIENKDLIELNLVLKDWLINHILESDMKLGEFIRSNQIDVSTLSAKS